MLRFTEWEQVRAFWSLGSVDERPLFSSCSAAYYFRCVIEMQKHWQNSFTAMENCVMWKGTQIITSTRSHTKADRHTHVGRSECNLAPCLKSLFNGSARICTCGLVWQERQRWKYVGGFLHYWIPVRVCSGVYYEIHISMAVRDWLLKRDCSVVWCFHDANKSRSLTKKKQTNTTSERFI